MHWIGWNIIVALLATHISCGAAQLPVLRCYRCVEMATKDAQPPRCSSVAAAPSYQELCPNSTMCLSIKMSLRLQNGITWTTILRGCANQVNIVHKLGSDRIFHEVPVITEPYEEGCVEHSSGNMLSAKVQYCHCRGSLCNTWEYRKISNSSGFNRLKICLLVSSIMQIFRNYT